MHLGSNTLPKVWSGFIDQGSKWVTGEMSSNTNRDRCLHLCTNTRANARRGVMNNCSELVTGEPGSNPVVSLHSVIYRYHYECAVANGVMDNASELVIGEQISISSRVLYIPLDTNALAKMRCWAIDNSLEWNPGEQSSNSAGLIAFIYANTLSNAYVNFPVFPITLVGITSSTERNGRLQRENHQLCHSRIERNMIN